MLALMIALFVVMPGAAHADPLTVLIASGLGSIGIVGVAGDILASLLTSVLLMQGSRLLAGKRSSGAETVFELQRPTSQPPYRFVFGKAWATGSPTGVHVKGNILYGCWILNSQPSEGPFTLLLDKRPVSVTGDPYDFSSGGGATANASPFSGLAKVWIGRGDQTTAPAQIVAEAPEFYSTTDAWAGLTVVWLRLDCGPKSSRASRWVAAPPEVMVDGYWSRIWDPRDVGQSQVDPATWAWSANQALCALHALLNNPLTPYDLRHLDMDSILWAADVADEAADVRGGGSTPRYEVNGTVVFSEGAELEDQLQPILDAGAAQWVRARGKLGIIPATPQDSALTLSDMLDEEAPTFVRYRSRDELFTEVSGTYLAPDRAYENTEAPVFVVSGAAAADGGLARRMQPDLSLITDHRQAQRVQKIMVMRSRQQRSVTGVFPPMAFAAVAGSEVTLDLPAPFTGWNGRYQIESLRPAIGGSTGGGVHLRCGLTLRETSSEVYAWDAETEEQVVDGYTLDASIPNLEPGGAITAITGATVAIVTGYGAAARIKFSFAPSASASVTQYEWQVRKDGGAWTPGGLIDADVDDGAGHVFGFTATLTTGSVYDIRVRAQSTIMTSGWEYALGTVASTGTERWLMDAATPSFAIDGVTRTLGQVVALTRATTATYVDASGVVQVAAVDEARIDVSTGTGALLVEPAATNLCLYSAAIDAAPWAVAGGTTVSANATTAPDGTTTADLITSGNAAGQSVYQAITVAASTTYTLSFWAQLGIMAAADFKMAVFNVSAGGFIALNAVPAVTPGSTWRRLSLTFTTPAGCTAINVYPFRNGAAVAGTFSLWGVQVEAGAAATSLVPTGAATVTRAADVASMTGLTAVLTLDVTYGDGTTQTFAAAPVGPGYWPALTKSAIRKITGTP